MKCTIPEISWHNKDPVLSIDVQPLTNEGFYRLATGGTDSHVLIWHLKILETGATSMEPVSDLTRHQRAVNVVRWSNSGQYLASGDDDANIIIWHQKSDDLAVMLDGDNDDKEKWNVLKVLRGHKEDVYDICWSPDSNKLISGSVDNTAIIWDVNKGLNDSILTDHKGFVQGVSWDPLGQYVATLSSDRICRLFTETGKQVKARLKKGPVPVPESHALHGQIVRYFHDDTLKSFFRRLTFSPDGRLIIAPAGCLEVPNNKKLYTTYIYTSCSLTQPAAIIPSPGQYSVAARCCPILFQLRPDGPDPVISLPYRVVFAIATRSSVVLYDTQQMTPFATISNIHYTRLTDVTWSKDGRVLAVSSTDGFCSLVTFEPEELGVEYVKEPEVMEEDANETVEEIMDTSMNTSVTIEEKKEKKPSFLKQWTMKIQDKSDSDKSVPKTGVKRSSEDVIEISDDDSNKKMKEDKPVSIIQVRRKPKESTTATNEEKSGTKIEKPVSVIAVRRKPKETEEKCEEKKENNDTKPVSKIAVRRTPRESLPNKNKLDPETKENIPNTKDEKSCAKVEISEAEQSKDIKNEKSDVAMTTKSEKIEEVGKKCEVVMETKSEKVQTDKEKSVVAVETKSETVQADSKKSEVAIETKSEKVAASNDKSKVTVETKSETVQADNKKSEIAMETKSEKVATNNEKSEVAKETKSEKVAASNEKPEVAVEKLSDKVGTSNEKSEVTMETKSEKVSASNEKSEMAKETKSEKGAASNEKSEEAVEKISEKVVASNEKSSEKSEVAMETKSKKIAASNEKSAVEKNSNKVISDDDVILLEKENITENVLKPQNDNKCTPKKEKQKIATPESKKKRGSKPGIKKSQITPSKSVSAKKKPREPPGGQMNITQFLTSKPITPSKPKVTEKKSRTPVILLEDYNKTGKTYGECSTNKSEIIVLDEESNSEMEVPTSVAQILNFDEDSQNIKLVLEDTVDEPLNNKTTTVEEEQMEIDTTEKSCSGKTNSNCDDSNQENKVVMHENKTNNSSDSKEENKETSCEDNKDKDIVTNGDKNENCDTKSISSNSSDIVVKELEKPTPLSNVLSLPKGSPAKKRVPLITLSSPKHKKKAL